MNNNIVLHIKALNKSYKSGDENLQILKDLDFSLDRGTSAVILGRSGSGKSTLLHLIGGLDTLDSGSIILNERHVENMRGSELEKYRRDEIGFIFQSHFLLDDFTILENIALPAIMNGIRKREALNRAESLLEHVGLIQRRNHYPKKVSGGERQRVAVARSLINNPSLILADEPTGNLDEFNSRKIEDLLFEIVEHYNRNLIMVTHDPSITSRGTCSYTLTAGQLEGQLD